ncbi:flagellar biosynthesis protein FliR [Anaerohalosphaera lusitana]|uniref:Flagellar biosynthesis protein FliR n=1 Tax=Anaerohalosphaera lusitana TaxID=1936003 RepID=A0A1U9NHC4_9BACT|nr:flagellar biosynthetic protein FliR [Anaerohalosphaera lusitana]AQT66906.1 flagellar biosynthesis protein FliR [Anaerohalosphaera lusitana]
MTFTSATLLGFVLVLTRLSVFFATAPIFSWITIPVRIKVGLALFCSFFFSLSLSPPEIGAGVGLLEVVLMFMMEGIYGLSLGLILTMLYSAVKVCGRILEMQMAMSMAQEMDPFRGERQQPLSILFEIIFLLLLLSANVHHMFLELLHTSFEAFGPGEFPGVAGMTQAVIEAGSMMLVFGLRLAIPALVVFTILMVVLAVMARIAPEMNILFLSLPFKVGLGLLIAAYLVPYIQTYVSEYANAVGRMLPI